MKPVQPSAALAAVVGTKPLPRTEIIKRLWAYIKDYGLQDVQNKRLIHVDSTLQPVFGGKPHVSMFELAKLVSQHVQWAGPWGVGLRHKVPLAGMLMVATIWVAAVFPSLPLQLVTLAGAVAMVLAGCPKPVSPGDGMDDDALREGHHTNTISRGHRSCGTGGAGRVSRPSENEAVTRGKVAGTAAVTTRSMTASVILGGL